MSIPIHPDSQRLLESIGLLRRDPTPAPNPYPPSSNNSSYSGFLASQPYQPSTATSAHGSVHGSVHGSAQYSGSHSLYESQSSAPKQPITPMQPMQPASANLMMLGQRPPLDVGGLHAVMSISDGYVTIDQLSPGGQLAMNGVMVGDALVAIDGRSVVGLSLRAVKAQLEGPSYSVMELEFDRGSPQSGQEPETFMVEIVRTPLVSEVSQRNLKSRHSCITHILRHAHCHFRTNNGPRASDILKTGMIYCNEHLLFKLGSACKM
jgi:hypothetical protein